MPRRWQLAIEGYLTETQTVLPTVATPRNFVQALSPPALAPEQGGNSKRFTMHDTERTGAKNGSIPSFVTTSNYTWLPINVIQ